METEIVSRVVRRTLTLKESDPSLVMAAEVALLMGLHQFESSPLMNIFYGCFLMDLVSDHSRGYTYLDKARPVPRDSVLRIPKSR